MTQSAGENRSKQWRNSNDFGSIDVTVDVEKVHVHIADDAVQRHYSKSCPLADYATEAPTDGWTPLRKILATDLLPEQRAEAEAYIAELLAARG